jgi:hypothetical protein
MKVFIGLLILIGKLYLLGRVLFWGIMELNNPELHTLSEIEGYLILLICDIWISVNVDKDSIKN